MRAELHTHTIYSDGHNTPLEVAKLVKENNIEVMAITDHDNIQGSIELFNMKSDLDFKIISGVEFTTNFRNISVHLLGYSFDLNAKSIVKLLEQMKMQRREYLGNMLNTIALRGIQLNKDKYLTNPIKPMSAVNQIVAELRDITGQNNSYIYKNYIYSKKKLPVMNYRLGISRAIEIIRQSGGVAVLAHPFRSFEENELNDCVEELCHYGLGGLECYYYSYKDAETNFLKDLANQKDLIITGGSDFHFVGSTQRIIGSSNAVLDERAIEVLGIDK